MFCSYTLTPKIKKSLTVYISCLTLLSYGTYVGNWSLLWLCAGKLKEESQHVDTQFMLQCPGFCGVISFSTGTHLLLQKPVIQQWWQVELFDIPKKSAIFHSCLLAISVCVRAFFSSSKQRITLDPDSEHKSLRLGSRHEITKESPVCADILASQTRPLSDLTIMSPVCPVWYWGVTLSVVYIVKKGKKMCLIVFFSLAAPCLYLAQLLYLEDVKLDTIPLYRCKK